MQCVRALALVVGLAASAFAQDSSWRSACFNGVNNTDSPAVIGDCEAQDALNVEANLGGTALLKRRGFSQNAALTVTTGPVTGSHYYKDSSGNNVTVVCQDRYCSKSVNGGAFSVFLSTAGGQGSVPTRWSFVDLNGLLYGGNSSQDPILKYNGTAVTYPIGMPRGSILALTQDRMVVGDISGSPNRVYYSSAGAVENFTIGGNDEDPFYDDLGAPGDKITGLVYQRGFLYPFKSDSITSCELGNQYTTKCNIVIENLGTNDPASIVVAGNEILFRGNDRAFWRFGSGGLEQVSRKIRTVVLAQTEGSARSNTQTTQSDWESGTQLPGGSWSTSTISGSVLDSSTTVIPNTAINTSSWYMTDADTAAPTTANFVNNFDNASLTNGLDWTVRQGFASGLGDELRMSSTYTIGGFYRAWASAVVEHSTGTWDFVFKSTSGCSGSSPNFEFAYWFLSSNFNYVNFVTFLPATNGYQFYLNCQSGTDSQVGFFRYDSGVDVFPLNLITQTGTCFCDGTTRNFRISRGRNGYTSAYINGVSTATFYDTTYTTSTYNIIYAAASDSGGVGTVHVDSTTVPAFYLGQVSTAYDTHYSTPIYGPYTVTFSSSINQATTFYAQVSADASSWDALVSLTNGARPAVAAKRYLRHSITPGPPHNGASVVMPTDASLLAATTGQYWTQCIQPGSSISSWGTLSCAETNRGAGSIVYYATSAVSCATLPTTPPVSWQTSPTNNAALTISTNTAMYIGWRSLLGSATDQAQVDSCVVNWTEGTAAQPVWGAWDSIKNAVYWTTTIGTSTYSNRLLKYDLNLDGWFPYSLTAQAPLVTNGTLYFGSASSGTWNQYGGSDSDNGGAINAYWITRDIGAAAPFQEKDFKRVSILSRNQGSGSLTATWTLSNGKTGNYVISLATGTGLNYARSNYNLPASSPQNFMNLRLGNNAASQPFEVLGLQVDYYINSWRVSGP